MMFAILAQSDTASLYLPPQDSTFAPEYDWTFYFIYYISAFFVVTISAAAIWFAVKYRRRAGRMEGEHTPTHHTALEMTWTIIPLIIVLAIFWFGFQGFLDKTTPPADTYKITVSASRWNWQFIYPNGARTNTLYVPADRPVELTLTSSDVIHSVFIPTFRVKKDAVPGRFNKVWFQARYDEARARPVLDQLEGDFLGMVHPLYCAEYCGQQHSVMHAEVVVLPLDQFRDAVAELAVPTGTLIEIGEQFTTIFGCTGCHAFDPDERVTTGPPLHGLFSNPERSVHADGTQREPDEEYVRESILYPGREIVSGYTNQMPSFAGQISDNQILAIIEYLKSISDHYEGDLLEHLPGEEPADEDAEPASDGDAGPTDDDAEPATEGDAPAANDSPNE